MAALSLLAGIAALLLAGGAKATSNPPPSGLYVMVDPYNQTDFSRLDAAATAAGNGNCAGAEPFCTETNGILLSIDWCRYQGYPDGSAPGPGTRDFSCHYVVGAKGNITVQQLAINEDVHQCAGTYGSPSYDECPASDLSKALADIVKLNQIRATNGGQPLLISLGLMSGTGTPETYLAAAYTAGTTTPPGSAAALDIPFNTYTGAICGLEPQVWLQSYVSAYLAAYDELLTYVHNTMRVQPTATRSLISLVKITPLNSISLEYFLPGLYQLVGNLPEPGGPDADDVPLNCLDSSGSGAQKWIAAYPTNASTTMSIIQAMEQTLGTTVGNLYAQLQALGETQARLSLATTNGAAYPQIDCGTSGSGILANYACTPQTYAADQWSTFYFEKHGSDLFITNSIARTAAINAAIAQPFGVTFALAAADFYVNTTNLQDPNTQMAGICANFGGTNHCASVSRGNLACDINETSNSTSQEGDFTLNNMMHNRTTGVGTSIGVQTVYGLDGSQMGTNYCTSNTPYLSTIFKYATDNGSRFIELTQDIAFNAHCQGFFQSTLTALLAQTKVNCLY